MSIIATCACGARIKATDELAGKQVKCPTCGQPLTIPRAAPAAAAPIAAPPPVAAPMAAAAQPIRVSCQCGKAFQAKPEMAGKLVRCPSCGGAITIPQPAGPSSNPQSRNAAADMLGLGPLQTDDPLQTGTAAADPLSGAGPLDESLFDDFPSAASQAPAAPVIRPAIVADTKKKKVKKSRATANFDQAVLLKVTAIICIIHGLWLLGNYLRLLSLISFSVAFLSTYGGMITLANMIVSAAILAAGIGLLVEQEWALPVGTYSAYAHFALLALAIISSFSAITQIAGVDAGANFVLRLLGRWAAQSVAPGMLIFYSLRYK